MILQDPKFNNGVPYLMDATPEELFELFKTLPCPTMEEMNGEYQTTKLPYDRPRDYIEWSLVCDNPLLFGDWIGKAFRPIDEKNGRGYNIWRKVAAPIGQDHPMLTTIAKSRWDDKDSFYLIYKPFNSLAATLKMMDEVRKLGDNAYLLCGTYGFTKGDKKKLKFWLLEGPKRPYRGDIGEPKDMDLQKCIDDYYKFTY